MSKKGRTIRKAVKAAKTTKNQAKRQRYKGQAGRLKPKDEDFRHAGEGKTERDRYGIRW